MIKWRLFAESFFMLPLIRRLEEDMSKIEFSDVDKGWERYRVSPVKSSRGESAANAPGLKEVQE